MTSVPVVTHTGGCHCGTVKFEVRAPARIEALACNCSICKKSGFLHLIVDRGNFILRQGDGALTTYAFNTRTAQHLFCRICGVKSFYVPRSHPDGYSVNVNCLETIDLADVRVREFNGAEWEASIASLAT